MGWGTVKVATAWLVLCSLGCDPATPAEARPEPTEPAGVVRREPASNESSGRAPVDAQGLLIGVFRLAPNAVVDGDTIRVEGIEPLIRLLSIDTEELFRGDEARAAKRDFAKYLERKRGNSARPVKGGTPMGETAKAFAEAFFDDVQTVRLERDDPKAIQGQFGRPLAHAFVQKDGRWTSYNVECVRQGMSPYFTKYGYSRRFHGALSRAEAEAREARRGIWSKRAQGYGDYDERKAWWNARADFIRAFEREANGHDDFINLSHSDAAAELERHLGKEVTVLSTIAEIERFKRLTRVGLTMTPEGRFPLIFFDRAVFGESGIGAYDGEPVVARGKVERYENGDYETLQIVIERAEQITTPTLPATD